MATVIDFLAYKHARDVELDRAISELIKLRAELEIQALKEQPFIAADEYVPVMVTAAVIADYERIINSPDPLRAFYMDRDNVE